MDFNGNVVIAFICDEGYVIPTAVAIQSVIEKKKSTIQYDIFIFAVNLSEDSIRKFNMFTRSDIRMHVRDGSMEGLDKIHTCNTNGFCVATSSALLKFKLPELLAEYDKVLYLDGDIIVCKDLFELYDENIEDYYAAVVVDSGSLYFKHEYVRKVKKYFNSGVMLLNLAKMRNDNVSNELIKTKKEIKNDSLMDQNVFNLVFDDKIKKWPITYNLLLVNLINATGKWDVEAINKEYSSDYSSLEQIKQNAYIIHFSSKKKPWKDKKNVMSLEWYKYLLKTPFNIKRRENLDLNYLVGEKTFGDIKGDTCPKVSVIIPIYNTEKYLKECINSALDQTFKDIEVICINDGSTDNSLQILETLTQQDKRIKFITQKNQGQSNARNLGLSLAKGEYIYFLDSDDRIDINAMKILYEKAHENDLDVILFDGKAVYASDFLMEKYPQYQKYYERNMIYEGIKSGQELYVQMVENGDYKVSPCLQFIKRSFLSTFNLFFYEGIIHEDNIFSFSVMLHSKKTMHIRNKLFCRCVREGSTMTSNVTYKNYEGYYQCIILMVKEIVNNKVSEEFLAATKKQLFSYLKIVQNINAKLDDYDLVYVYNADLYQLFFHDILMGNFLSVENQKLKNELDIIRQHATDIEKGWSFRIGRKATVLPRKIRDCLMCYQKNGLKYTLCKISNKIHRSLRL